VLDDLASHSAAEMLLKSELAHFSLLDMSNSCCGHRCIHGPRYPDPTNVEE